MIKHWILGLAVFMLVVACQTLQPTPTVAPPTLAAIPISTATQAPTKTPTPTITATDTPTSTPVPTSTLPVTNTATPTATVTPANTLHSLYQWLLQQQDCTTGLLPSQQDAVASTYNNALAVIVFTLKGDSTKSEAILDFFSNQADEFYGEQCDDFSPRCSESTSCDENTPCGFFQFRSSETGVPLENVNRWMGDNAWLLIAIHHYEVSTNDLRYRPMAEAIVHLLKSFQQPEGYIASGWERGESFRSDYHAEGNLDAYKALTLRNETTAAQAVKNWLDFTDLEWKDGPLDLHSWRVLSLGKEYGFCLPDTERTADETIRYKSTVDYNSSRVTGFLHKPTYQYNAECQMSDNIWVEGTGQMAVSFCKADYEEQWKFYVGELEKLLFEPDDFPGTQTLPFLALPDRKCHSWVDLSKGHVAAVSWYIFAKQRFDPFDGAVMNCSSQRQNPVARIEAENYDGAPGVRFDDRGQVYEGKAIHIGGDNSDPGDESGEAEYAFNVLTPIDDATIRMRYADNKGGDTVSIFLDSVPIASFNTEYTGSWDIYTETNPFSVASGIDSGLHTLRVQVIDGGTFGLTVDGFRIDERASVTVTE